MTSFPPSALEMSFMLTAHRILLASDISDAVDKKQRLLPHLSQPMKLLLREDIVTLQKALKVCRHMNRFATQNQRFV